MRPLRRIVRIVQWRPVFHDSEGGQGAVEKNKEEEEEVFYSDDEEWWGGRSSPPEAALLTGSRASDHLQRPHISLRLVSNVVNKQTFRQRNGPTNFKKLSQQVTN